MKSRLRSSLSLLLLATFTSHACVPDDPVPLATEHQEVNVFDPGVFDWRFYVNAYGDLLQAGIDTPAEAQAHWQNFGMRECRRAHPRFHPRQYLSIYPDLQQAFGTNCTLAVQHYLQFGRNEGRAGILNGGFDGRYTVSNDLLTVGASLRTAGAIDSLYWNGREFINSYDHGRQLQVALSTNGFGECENPTEAGSRGDGSRPGTTSVLHAATASGNVLTTDNQPAYWIAPGQSAPGCGLARNQTALSSYRFRKTVTVGVAGIRHAIEVRSSIVVPAAVSSLTYEGATGYLGGEFTAFHTFNPASCALAPISAGPGEQGLPIVLSTPDGAAAMGTWSPDLPQPGLPNLGYGRFAFPSSNPANATNKWNAVFRFGALAAGTYAFRSYVAVGSRENVRVALCQLKAAIH
ncbi:MAG: hypothetical protein R3B48_23345 [Kofleriaceae bacterium]